MVPTPSTIKKKKRKKILKSLGQKILAYFLFPPNSKSPVLGNQIS
jgi:hypothetical protein